VYADTACVVAIVVVTPSAVASACNSVCAAVGIAENVVDATLGKFASAPVASTVIVVRVPVLVYSAEYVVTPLSVCTITCDVDVNAVAPLGALLVNPF